MRPTALLVGLTLLSILATSAGGCIWFDAGRSIREAARAVEDAQALGAPDLSPYLYGSAARLLEGAKAEYAESDFPMAIELARKSREQALSAGAEATAAEETENEEASP